MNPVASGLEPVRLRRLFLWPVKGHATVGYHRADHEPEHASGSISDEGSEDGKWIKRPKDETAVWRHPPRAQKHLTWTAPLPKSGV